MLVRGVARRWLEHHGAELVAVRTVSPLTVVAAVLAHVTWVLFVFAWLFRARWLDDLERATGFVIQGTLLAGFGSLAITLAITRGLGGLRASEIGLRWRDVRSGLVWTGAVWLGVQLVLATGALAAGDGLALDPVWHRPGLTVGMFLSQLPGNAFAEEVLDRGFLLVQCVLLARRVFGSRVAWIAGVLVSQSIFALGHIPQRWVIMDISGLALVANLVATLGAGLLFSLIYLRTGNLVLAAGLHALSNVAVPVFASPVEGVAIASLSMYALVIVWPYLPARIARPAARGRMSRADDAPRV
jgi:hypothetical protein